MPFAPPGLRAALLVIGCLAAGSGCSQSVRTLSQEQSGADDGGTGGQTKAEETAKADAKANGSKAASPSKAKSPAAKTEEASLPDDAKPLRLNIDGPDNSALKIRAEAPEPRGIGVSFIGQVLRLTMPNGYVASFDPFEGAPVVKVSSDEVMRGRQVIAIRLEERAIVRFSWAGRNLTVSVAGAAAPGAEAPKAAPRGAAPRRTAPRGANTKRGSAK